MKLKKVLAVLMCTAVVSTLGACGTKTNSKTENTTAYDSENMQIANPWIDCKDMKEAVEKAGFDFTVPDTIGDYEIVNISCVEGETVDVIYQKGDDSEDQIKIRKGIETDIETFAGDYGTYSDVEEVKVGDLTVTEKGDNGRVETSTWQNGKYMFAVYTNAVSPETVADIVSRIK